MKLPGLRREREARFWTITDLKNVTGLTWQTCATADSGGEVSPATAKKILLALEANPVSPTARSLLSGPDWTPGVETSATKEEKHGYLPGQGGLCCACSHTGRVIIDLESSVPRGFRDDPIHIFD